MVVTTVGVISFSVIILILLLMPTELYTVQGEIIRIEEIGYIVNVVTVQPSAPAGEVIINPLDITASICQLDPEFGRENCRLGVKVELTRLENAFREWWYLNALIKDYDKDYDYVEEEA